MTGTTHGIVAGYDGSPGAAQALRWAAREAWARGTTLTVGGIVLPDTAKDKPQRGKVLAVGEGRLDDNGRRVPMNVKPGDIITWDVQGVEIPTRITSLRKVVWTRFEPNFFVVFAPPVLKGAPNQYVLLAQVKDPTAVALLQREVVNRFPNVSSIDLTAIKRTVDKIVGKVSLAIRFMALFSLAVAIPVLFSAVSASVSPSRSSWTRSHGSTSWSSWTAHRSCRWLTRSRSCPR